MAKISRFIGENTFPLLVEGDETDADGDPWPRAFIEKDRKTWVIIEDGNPSNGRPASLAQVISLFGGGDELTKALNNVHSEIIG
jgi:hypothetical protein